MALVVMDGFDMYNGTGAEIGLSARYSQVRGSGVGGGQSMAAGRFGGGQSLASQPTTNSNIAYCWRQHPITPVSSLALGFGLRCDLFPNVEASFMGLWNGGIGGTAMFTFSLNPSGNITFRSGNNGGLFGTTAGGTVAPITTWHYIEILISIATSGSILCYVDGSATPAFSFSGNTNAGAGSVDTTVLGVYTGNTGNASGFWPAYIDDFYMADSTTRLGEMRIDTLRGASDVSAVWTPNSGVNNFSRINENLVDGDTTYVQTGGVGNLDLYGISALSSNSSSILAANAVAFAKKTDAGSRVLQNAIKSGAVESDGTGVSLFPSYARFDRIVPLDPNGSIPWTYTAINALNIGPKLAA